MKKHQFIVSLVTIIFTLFFGFVSLTTQVQASELIVFKYGLAKHYVSVEHLNKFAQTGEKNIGFNLRFKIAKLAKIDPEEIRKILNKNITVNKKALSNLLNDPFGKILLDSFSEVISSPTEESSQQSLQEALLKSTNNDNQLNLMEIIVNYPSEEVDIKLGRLLQIYKKIENIQQ